ncbi:MAG: hypothetical protein U9P49_13690 [Thermodesulfobacteriota bacterium]|nr:hypothetical protein [Thermodesulfobacteriota bacterium]
MLTTPCAHAKEYSLFGQDRIVGAGLLEDHSEALVRLAGLGIKDAVLINIDAHDDLRRISPDKIKKLKSLVQKKDWKSIEMADSGGDHGLYHPGSFIYAACRLGLIGRVYWIIPFSYFQGTDTAQALNTFMAAYGFDRQCIETFSLNNGCYEGTYAGIPLTICGIEHLPKIDEPVILSIDADFFPPFANWYNRDILTSMSVFFFAMANRGYRIQDAFVACSINGGFLDAARRWIADYCMEILKQPKLIEGPYPEAWLVHNLADTYYAGGNAEALLDLTRRYQNSDPQDRCLMAYQAFALHAAEDRRGAFELACVLARLDNRYAFVLADLGQFLIDQGNLEEALKYFYAAYQANPHMNFRQKNLGDALMAAGRYNEALHYYGIYCRKNGSFPVAFVMGDASLRLGDDSQAYTYFEQGTAVLKNIRYKSELTKIDADAIRHAANFFRRKNRRDTMRIITLHPFMRDLFESSGGNKTDNNYK